MPPRSTPDTFWRHVMRGAPDDCWEWAGSRHPKGYGWVSYQRKSGPAHRVAWTLTLGDIPEGMWVLHRCDNPPCCNPAHLFLGDNAANVADKIAKGRQPNGTLIYWRATLTDERVAEILSLYASGGRSYVSIGRQFNVSPGCISSVVYGLRWTHVPRPPGFDEARAAAAAANMANVGSRNHPNHFYRRAS